MLALGAVSALAAAGAGLLLGGSGGYGGSTFEWHQRLGVIVAIGASLTCAGWIAARRSNRGRAATVVYRTLLATTVSVLIVAGHLGATLTHGEGYLTEHAPAPVRGLLSPLLGGADAAARVARADQAVAYSSLVQPVLGSGVSGATAQPKRKASCGSTRPTRSAKAASDGPVIVPGRAAESEIVRRIWLPSVAQGRDAARRQPGAACVGSRADPLVGRSGRAVRSEAVRARRHPGRPAGDRGGGRPAAARRTDAAGRERRRARSAGGGHGDSTRRIGCAACQQQSFHRAALHQRGRGGSATRSWRRCGRSRRRRCGSI